MVKAYSWMTILIFLFGTAATGLSLFGVYSNKPLCVTVNGTQTCSTSNFSTAQKVGFTAWIAVQWLIDLCKSLSPFMRHNFIPINSSATSLPLSQFFFIRRVWASEHRC